MNWSFSGLKYLEGKLSPPPPPETLMSMIMLPILPETGICLSEPEEGDCNFITPSYFYNATSGRCEEVAYTNCGVNRFATEERCIERCNPDGMFYFCC